MIKCTAGRCTCSRCGTPGRGDMQAALARVREKVQAELRRLQIREGGKPIGVVVGENEVSPPYGH